MSETRRERYQRTAKEHRARQQQKRADLIQARTILRRRGVACDLCCNVNGDVIALKVFYVEGPALLSLLKHSGL